MKTEDPKSRKAGPGGLAPFTANVVQRRGGGVAAPPVYRPLNPVQRFAAPPVYRPAGATLAPLAGGARQPSGVQAPPVYRPNQPAQAKPAPATHLAVGGHFPPVALASGLLQRKPGGAVHPGFMLPNPQRMAGQVTPVPELRRAQVREGGLNGSVAQPMLSFLKRMGGGGGDDPDENRRRREAREAEEARDVVNANTDAIRLMAEANPQIHVIWNSLTVPLPTLKRYIEQYLSGGITLYRGSQQSHPAFPIGNVLALTPKVPGSPNAPDFAANDNDWIPMTPSKQLAESVALSWSHSIVGYFNSRGGMDSARPVALIATKTIRPPTPIAFAFDDEIQFKGSAQADSVDQVMIDTDWGTISAPHVGSTFRAFATNAGMTIR